jgi:hypothetical protein
LRERVEHALRTLQPLLRAPDERQGRRLAWGMARTTQASLLAAGAEWRLQQHGDRSGLTAAELFVREPLVAEPVQVGDAELAALAFGAVGEGRT